MENNPVMFETTNQDFIIESGGIGHWMVAISHPYISSVYESSKMLLYPLGI